MKKRDFVVGMHFKPENGSKSLEFCFSYVGFTRGTVGIAYEQNPTIMTASVLGLKIATKMKMS